MIARLCSKLMHHVGRQRTTPNPEARKPVPVFWSLYLLYADAGAFFPVVRRFSDSFPQSRPVLQKGLYNGLASAPLLLYSKPRVGVTGGCLSCDHGDAEANRQNNALRNFVTVIIIFRQTTVLLGVVLLLFNLLEKLLPSAGGGHT